ncbi:DHH family phosphoesterase [Candidatus Woesearchaeota archaeon]|nr:DHH family phosphoesterase [Candidatus Woesearchaeota archaeon]
MLTPAQIQLLREELETAKNPLFFHDDDPDGVCAFLLLYRLNREGHNVIVKSGPKIDLSFLRKVEEYHPDKIFILDVPIVEQDFIDQAKRPMFWIDHHQPLQRTNIRYFNPRLIRQDLYLPSSYMAYEVNNNPDDLWIAVVGCLYDWHLPEFIDEFIQKYPDLLSKKTTIGDAVYKQPMKVLIRLFSFLMKGKTSDVQKSIKILTRIKSPYEILRQESPAGRFLYARFEKINQKYDPLLKAAKKKAGREKILLFEYTEQQWSFTTDLANELAYLYPKKVIIIARKKSGEMKCSLRGATPILPALEKALVGIQGYGGGHDVACGAVIKEEDWKQFLENFEGELHA